MPRRAVTLPAVFLAFGVFIGPAEGTTNDVNLADKIDAEPIRNESGEVVDWKVDLGITTREEAIKELNRELELLDQRYNELPSQSDATDEKAQAKWAEQMKALQKKRQALRDLLDRSAEVDDATWLEMNPSLRNARDELKQALDEAEAEYTDTVKAN